MRLARAAFGLVKGAYFEWSEDKAPRLGAALAYYTVFSLAPLLLVVIAIAAFVFGEKAAQGQIVGQIEGLIGPDSARAIQDMLANAQKPSSGIVATVVGVVMLLAGASGVFGQLQDALNTVWEVEPKPDRGLVGIVRDRFLSLTMVLGTGFLLLVSLVLSAALATAGQALHRLSPGLEAIGHVVEIAVSFGIVSLLFALIFKYLPDAKIAWRDVWFGAVVTAALFVIGKFAIGLYLGHASIGSAYGAAGSFVVILVWVYYSAQILLFGAELTQVYANRSGSRVKPAENAVRISEKKRAEQGIPRSA
jgi:membrane protein